MTTPGYTAPVDDAQRTRLRDAQCAVEETERAERDARARLGDVVRAANADGWGPTAIARCTNDDLPADRRIHRVTVQALLPPVGEGGGARARSYHGQVLDPDSEHGRAVRTAHRALHDAEQAAGAAFDARIAVFVALNDEGVSAEEQAGELGLSKGAVQGPITAVARATGRPRRSRRYA